MKIYIINEEDISGLRIPEQQMIRHCLQAIKDKRPAGSKKIAFESDSIKLENVAAIYIPENKSGKEK